MTSAALRAATNSAATPPLHAFAAVGVEIEYMIVDRGTLDVRPVADALLAKLSGSAGAGDARRGLLAASNELVAHLVEIKNVLPTADLASLRAPMAQFAREIDAALGTLDARLLPGGMHPWMDPRRETVLWPLGGAPIYAAYDRIFDCRRHGYANLQAMHINLPFADDREFARLHAAVRLALPLVPALAASSPFIEGRRSDVLDTRLLAYRGNAVAFPAIAGRIVPETLSTRADYDAHVLVPMYEQIAPADPEGLLRHEWLNARGAIARFDRHAIEIRLADTQECAYADLAVAAAVTCLVRSLYEERWSTLAEQQAMRTEALVAVLDDTIRDGEHALVTDHEYRRALGWTQATVTVGDVWARLLCESDTSGNECWRPAWKMLCDRGPLARRILHAVGDAPPRDRLREAYTALADCLRADTMFEPS